MAQINNLTSYPTATPVANSIVIGSIASGDATNNFLMSDIANYVASTITFQDVCDQGSSTTTDITVGGVAYLARLSVSSVASFSFVDVSAAIDANSTADIADTLTLSKATGTGLYVEANAIVNGRLNVSGNTSLTNLEVTGATFRLAGSVPSSSTDTGSAGQIAVDATHIYVCVGTDSWGRVAIDTTPF